MNRIFRLGKLPARHDPRTLRLSSYLRPAVLPTPPAIVNYTNAVADWLMFRNDQVGDCAIAGPAHLDMGWTALAGKPFAPSDDDVIAAYSAVSGFDPASGDNDNGCCLLDVLKFWRNVGIGGRKIGAWAAVSPASAYRKFALWSFEGLLGGLLLPNSAQDQIGGVWDVVDPQLRGDSAPGSWGGHCITLHADAASGLTAITWGAKQRMTERFLRAYCDELYAVLSPDILSGAKRSPEGFDLAALQTDLKAVAA
jgi:hypothetical protein